MFAIRSILVIFCFNYCLGYHKELCDTDRECILNSIIDRVYPWFMTGIRGLDPADPLKINVIIADLPNLHYKLQGASLYGLKYCQFGLLNHTWVDESMVYGNALDCPAVTLISEYEVNGLLDSVPVKGKGICRIIYENLHIIYDGRNIKVKDDIGAVHFNIVDYTVKYILKGGVKSAEYSHLFFKDNKTTESRRKRLEQITQKTVMDAFMNKLIQSLQNFHRHIPIEDLHYKYVL